MCHSARPLVFRSGLWSVDVEKSWSHLFDMVATVACGDSYQNPSSSRVARMQKRISASCKGSFPTIAHVVILRDTWAGLVEQMHDLGLAAVVRLFKINYNLRFVRRLRSNW